MQSNTGYENFGNQVITVVTNQALYVCNVYYNKFSEDVRHMPLGISYRKS